MNNPYRNGKTMSPSMTLLAMVYEAGARAALTDVRERWYALGDANTMELGDLLDEINASMPPPAPKEEPTATP